MVLNLGGRNYPATAAAAGLLTAADFAKLAAYPAYSAPTYAVLGRTVVGSGGVASVDLSGTFTDYVAIVVEALLRGETAALTTDVRLRLNADTGANYDYSLLYQDDSTTPSRISSLAATSIVLGGCPAATATAGEFGELHARLVGPGAASWRKLVHADTSWFSGTDWLHMGAKGHWRSTAAITSLTLYLTTGDIAEGSLVALYGIRGE